MHNNFVLFTPRSVDAAASKRRGGTTRSRVLFRRDIREPRACVRSKTAYSIISTVTDDLGKLGMGFPSTKLSTFVLFRTRSVCSKNFRAPFY